MPECHKCKHDGKHSKVCVRCAGPGETNHKGRSHISLDASNDGGQTLGDVLAVASASAKGRPPMMRSRADRLAAVTAFMAIMEMDDRSFRIVRARFRDPSVPLSVLAKRYRVSTQAVHQRLQSLAEAWPGVRELVGLRLGRGR